MSNSSVSGDDDDTDSSTQEEDAPLQTETSKESFDRIVNWNVDVFKKLLKNIVAHRQALGTRPDVPHRIKLAEKNLKRPGQMVLDEVQDVIVLPKYDAKIARKEDEIEGIKLDEAVVSQLHDYVSTIAQLYRNNPFHNYEHAMHMSMSCVKLLSRIISPDIETDDKDAVKILHDHTYGITSDPLIQFSVVLSGLIHDADHQGVPNAQLTKENNELSVVYQNKSIAEQNSLDLAWELLMEPKYEQLRRTIYTTVEELKRFRQLVVNAVMATDIMDKELGQQRKARWNKAFAEDMEGKDLRISMEEDTNRKATIVIEHIIQASDVAHTMQHWHVYRKFNERLFRECYAAYKEGRAAKNPVDGWYEGEIGFFDFYIIPLAKKLKNCGVFGVSSDEYLNYAQNNRREWVAKGKQIVIEYVEALPDDH